MTGFKDFFKDSEAEYLSERAIAAWGDWDPKRDRVASKSIRSLKCDFEKIDTIILKETSFDLYKHKTKDWFLLGKMSEPKLITDEFDKSFEVIFKIEFNRREDVESSFKQYKNVVNVDGVMTREDMRGMYIGRFMYRYFVKTLKYTILGDEIQYHKARLLWVRLSKLDTVKVDIIDIETDKVLERDVILHHGEADYEFDERIWDYSDIKKYIRLVLTDVL